jgi:hypothetical protein
MLSGIQSKACPSRRITMSDFVVKIDTAKLSDKQAADVAGAIQGAVLRELARLDLALPSGPTGAITFHPEWRGLWLRNFRDLQGPQGPQVPALAVIERK